MDHVSWGFHWGAGNEIFLEVDEYDSAYFDKTAKFLHYLPDIGVINHVEFDHADIYTSLDEIALAFRRFVNLIPRSGLLAACFDFDTVREVCRKAFCRCARSAWGGEYVARLRHRTNRPGQNMNDDERRQAVRPCFHPPVPEIITFATPRRHSHSGG